MKDKYYWMGKRWTSDTNTLCIVEEIIILLNVFKKELEEFYGSNISIDFEKDYALKTVLRGIIIITEPFRKIKLCIWEDGTIYVKKPNGKSVVYMNKSPKQLIAILNAIIKNAK